MDHAGAAVDGHVVGQVDRRQAIVERVLRVQRVLEADAFELGADGGGDDRAFQLVAGQHRLHQLRTQDQQLRLAVTLDLHQRVADFGAHVQGLVRRDGPRGRGPDDDETFIDRQLVQAEGGGDLVVLVEREADVDRRVALVLVFDFGLGQRRTAVEAPVDGLQAPIDIAFFEQGAERAQLVGLIAVGHGHVRVVPLAQHAQADEAGALAVDLLERIGARLLQHFGGRQVLAVQFFDLDLDRHAVAIPARHVGRVEAGDGPRLDHHVLEDLVDGVAQVDVAVGVRRTVVQDEGWTTGGGLAHALIDFLVLPLLDPARLALGEVAAHREWGVGHIDRVFAFRLFWALGAVVLFGIGHKLLLVSVRCARRSAPRQSLVRRFQEPSRPGKRAQIRSVAVSALLRWAKKARAWAASLSIAAVSVARSSYFSSSRSLARNSTRTSLP